MAAPGHSIEMAMPRIAKPRVLEESRRKAAANRRSVSHANEPAEAVDDVERKFRETRLYSIAPISNNLVLAYLGQHVLGMPRSY